MTNYEKIKCILYLSKNSINELEQKKLCPNTQKECLEDIIYLGLVRKLFPLIKTLTEKELVKLCKMFPSVALFAATINTEKLSDSSIDNLYTIAKKHDNYSDGRLHTVRESRREEKNIPEAEKELIDFVVENPSLAKAYRVFLTRKLSVTNLYKVLEFYHFHPLLEFYILNHKIEAVRAEKQLKISIKYGI